MKIQKTIDEPVQATPFELLGGDDQVRALVERFYDLMDTDPRFIRLRSLHQADLSHARTRLYWFLSGWLGGPALYMQNVGHPMLRARHLPFPIGRQERDQWMACMTDALAPCNISTGLRERLIESFQSTADWMRNQAG